MIVDDVIAALPQMRTQAEALMLDSCTITRVTGQTFNDDTGEYEDTTETVYEGKCRFQGLGGASGVTDPVAGGYEFTLQDQQLQLPVVGSEGIALDDEVRCTTCALDDELVGRQFTVKSLFHKSQATSRRLVVTEVTG